jgi:hypothetical protein
MFATATNGRRVVICAADVKTRPSGATVAILIALSTVAQRAATFQVTATRRSASATQGPNRLANQTRFTTNAGSARLANAVGGVSCVRKVAIRSSAIIALTPLKARVRVAASATHARKGFTVRLALNLALVNARTA